MKHHNRLLAALLVILSTAQYVHADGCCSCRTNSQTFYPVRPPFQVSSPERLAHFRDDRVERKEDGWLGAVQIVPLGGSMMHSDNMARYFLPFCKNKLTVNEAEGIAGTDILANQLNIYTTNGNFSSTVIFEPHHNYVGAGFYYQQEFFHSHSGRAAWFSISFPVLNVRNRIDIKETVNSNGGGILAGPVADASTSTNPCAGCIESETLPTPRAANVVEAFQQPGWCYGRVESCKTQSKTGVADVEIRAAFQLANNEHSHFESWAGIVIPTGNQSTGRFLFEPIVGNNHHYAAILGSSFGVHVWESEYHGVQIFSEFDFNIQYFFAQKEVRSADLNNKPWSRYMQVYSDVVQATNASTAVGTNVGLTLGTAGINVLTTKFKVKPGFARTFNAAWDILWRCYEFEIGYNFWARQAECVELACNIPTDVAQKSLEGFGMTDSIQQIYSNFPTLVMPAMLDEYATNVLTASNINLFSVAAPAQLTHTPYISVARDWYVCEYPTFVSIGGSYEFSPDNTAMDRWMLFGKVGISF